jgi:hypothetical protein
MLHGTITANTDHYVTQSGACSIYGGVDTWSGFPSRMDHRFEDNFMLGRFSNYNQTQLVKGTKAKGTSDWGVNAGAAENLMPAAILRLPFPMNPAMVESTYSEYHDGTMDWDIDPGREGASVGFFSYAPGYWNGAVRQNTGNGLHYSQFVNGVSRLAIPGEPKQQDMSQMVTASDFQEVTANANTAFDDVIQAWIIDHTNGVFEASARIPNVRGNITSLVATHVINPATTDVTSQWGVAFVGPGVAYSTGAAPGSYVTGTPPEYTASVAINNSNDFLICVCPGTVQAYFMYDDIDAYPMMHLDLKSASGGSDRQIKHTFIVQESSRQSYLYGVAGALPSSTDLIRIPFGSTSIYSGQNSFAYGSSATSLKGRTIEYPSSWGATTETALENFLVASTSIHSGYGRGIYFGTTTARYSMPVMVPGSGTNVRSIAQANTFVVESTAQPPESYPVGPSSSPFAPSPKRWLRYDHGGPLAYCFYGLAINPSANTYKGQVTMQVSGGPTMGEGSASGALYSSDIVDGTAIDAFWPSKRPLLKNGQ